MKYLVALLLLTPVMAESVKVSPTFVRMPVNSTQTITLDLIGSGKTYDLKIYGPYLEWQEKKVWVGKYGKTLTVEFSPQDPGNFEISVKFGRASDTVIAEVFVPEDTSSLYNEIKRLKESTKDPKALEIIEEAENLYNQSKFQLAEIKLQELEDLPKQKTPELELPKIVLVIVLALLSVVSLKILFT